MKSLLLSLFVVGTLSTGAFAQEATEAPKIDPTVDRLLSIIEKQLDQTNRLNIILIQENRALTEKLQKNCEKKSLKERLFGS